MSLSTTSTPTQTEVTNHAEAPSLPSTPSSLSLAAMQDHHTASPRIPPHNLPVLPVVECIVRARIPTTSGTEIWLHLYKNSMDTKEHLAIVFGCDIRSVSLDSVKDGESEMDRMIRGAYIGRLYPGRINSREGSLLNPNSTRHNTTTSPPPITNDSDAPLVRIHSECYTGETTWSARCDCGEQLDTAAKRMSEEGRGVIVYLRQEGRGIGLGEKLKAYNLQDLGNDTVEANLLLRHPADARTYGVATSILLDLGLRRIKLLTNNPDKISAVEGAHKEIKVVEREPMVPKLWQDSPDGDGGVRSSEVAEYLKAKVCKKITDGRS